MSTYCKLSASHKCENEAGLKHFIKHGEIHGCAGCCLWCKEKDTCEYRCVYVKGALTPAQEAKPSTPAFDFSPLGDLAGAAADADNQFDLHYGTAQDEYLISCIYLARIHALTAKAGRYGGGTWTKWYESKGLSHGSVTKMVQNGEAFNSSTVDELKQLPNLTRKDLNLIARSGCADQVVAAAGDSQRVQELLAQLKAEKSRADTAEAHLEAAHADISGLKDRATAAEAREEEAWSMVSKAQDEAKAAQENLDYEVSQNDALHEEKGQLLRECEAAKQARAEAEARAQEAEKQLEGSRQVAEAAKLRADKLKAENDALKKQPITAVVDEEEVDRRAGEKAYEIAAGMTADYKVKQEQDARDAYDSIILAGRSITSIVQSTKLQFRKLPDDQRESAINQLVHTLASAQGEVSACL